METCGHDNCNRMACDTLIWRPSEMMVADGAFSVAMRCREHPVGELAGQLKRADPQAKIWLLVMNGSGPFTPAAYQVSRSAGA